MHYRNVMIHILWMFAIYCVQAAEALDCKRIQKFLDSKEWNLTRSSLVSHGYSTPICSANNHHSCCSHSLETNITAHNINELEAKVNEHNIEVKNAFNKMYTKFDDYFTQLIKAAATSVDELFLITYGELYSNNSDLFMDLFRDLEAFYRGSSLDIQDGLETFFARILQRGFQLLHSKRLFSDDYLQCIADNMYIIQPFALTPDTISSQIQSSFTHARNFVRGLKVGKQFEGTKLNEGRSCHRALTKLSTCPLCQGHLTNKPCYGLCLNVMNGCLVENHHLQQGWNDYIDALRSYIYHLEGPYNIEAVLDPIDVKISEAIMMLQNNNADITAAVFEFCGTPPLNPNATSAALSFSMELVKLNDVSHSRNQQASSGRKKSSSHHAADNDSPRQKRSTKKAKTQRSRKRKRNRSKRKEKRLNRRRIKKKTTVVNKIHEKRFEIKSSRREPKLSIHISEVKQVLDDYELHWMALAPQICREKAEESDTCWNGKSLGKYGHQVAGNGIKQQKTNPEVEAKNHVKGLSTQQQMLSLRRASQRLRGDDGDVFQGLDDIHGMDYSGADSTDKTVEKTTFTMVEVTTSPTTNASMTSAALQKVQNFPIITFPVTECDDCGTAATLRTSRTFISFLALFVTLWISFRTL